MTKPDIFKYFKTSSEIIKLAVMMYVRFPLSLRNVEDLLYERGIEISHESSGSGGIDLVRYSPLRSGKTGSIRCAHIRTGSGIWTKFS